MICFLLLLPRLLISRWVVVNKRGSVSTASLSPVGKYKFQSERKTKVRGSKLKKEKKYSTKLPTRWMSPSPREFPLKRLIDFIRHLKKGEQLSRWTDNQITPSGSTIGICLTLPFPLVIYLLVSRHEIVVVKEKWQIKYPMINFYWYCKKKSPRVTTAETVRGW